ncbi:sensor histidine kinase [Nakamurella antarctica]|uniref:histidine kinase n=1 Tax=Nakamurella antarctica TaxID=1902245 RepID=A0A3G8ZKG9_9ACTN|nr:HAMP domain-containing sensor histidine kinase [Nakamurella antarctica]AZI57700.1 sensor histidine kinase [Nakamurella antarctica]
MGAPADADAHWFPGEWVEVAERQTGPRKAAPALRRARKPAPTPEPVPAPEQHPQQRSGRGSLRLRLTLLSTAILALVGLFLLLLAYILVGRIAATIPEQIAGQEVNVGGAMMAAGDVAAMVADQAQRSVLVFGCVAFPLQLITGAWVAWVLIGRTLRPLSTLTRAAKGLSEASLDRRINLSGPHDEVAELADTFDEMTARLQRAFAAERRFVANASHEIRTPLAVMRTEVDVTLADPNASVSELRQMGEVVREATKRADRLLESLLVLARTQASGLSEITSVNLATLIAPAVADIEPEWRAKGLKMDLLPHKALVQGDPSLLARLVGNLVENAVRHNVSGGWVDVRTGVEQGHVHLTVRSSGPVIGAAAVAELFEPFRQGARARTAHTGSGLGLSIVKAVVAAHGGVVTGVPVPNGGLEIRVSLPLAAH